MQGLGKWIVWSVLLSAVPAAPAAWPIAPGATIVELYSVPDFYEGPSWDPVSGFLYFTDLTGTTRILRLDAPQAVTVWMNNTQGLNGTFLGLGNRLLAAQGNARKILSMRIGAAGPGVIKGTFYFPSLPFGLSGRFWRSTRAQGGFDATQTHQAAAIRVSGRSRNAARVLRG